MNKTIKGIIIFIIIALLVFLTFSFLLPAIKTGIRDRIINEFTNNEYKEELTRLDSEWQMPSNLEKENIEIEQMGAFWIKNSNASHNQVLLNLHGGAYILSLDSHPTTYERMSSNYANYGNIDVLTIDYRTSPDYPYPYALNDALKGYQYLLNLGYESENITLAGSSAGGGLALALTLYLKDHDMDLPRAIITMSAWADLSKFKYLSKPYVGNNDPKDPYISPSYGNYEDFPNLLLQVGEEQVTEDSYIIYDKAIAAGVNVIISEYEGMPHVFQNLDMARTEVINAWKEVQDFIENLN